MTTSDVIHVPACRSQQKESRLKPARQATRHSRLVQVSFSSNAVKHNTACVYWLLKMMKVLPPGCRPT